MEFWSDAEKVATRLGFRCKPFEMKNSKRVGRTPNVFENVVPPARLELATP